MPFSNLHHKSKCLYTPTLHTVTAVICTQIPLNCNHKELKEQNKYKCQNVLHVIWHWSKWQALTEY